MNGHDLIRLGFKPGSDFTKLLTLANSTEGKGMDAESLVAWLQTHVTPEPETIPLRTNNLDFGIFLEAQTADEQANKKAVIEHMDILMRTPTIRHGAIMPDACPSGSQPGTIPVGGVVACENAIHPDFHSADICCSMAISVFKRRDFKRAMDALDSIVSFGPFGRKTRLAFPKSLHAMFENQFLRGLEEMAHDHFGTQGDGNHFAYIGELASNGDMVLVTHHGSRGPGAALYRRGKAIADRHTGIVSPKTPKNAAWIKADSDEGRAYWDALQKIRDWSRENHFVIHDMLGKLTGNAITGRFWNEHNFVFRKDDGLFYHAKGATPSYQGFGQDSLSASNLTLIPMNMAAPILIASADKKQALTAADDASLGFAPHGAGRNIGRGQFMRSMEKSVEEMIKDLSPLDIRFHQGHPDASELPDAYKNAESVRAQIEMFSLTTIVDTILPYGSIMAGNRSSEAEPWSLKRKKEKGA